MATLISIIAQSELSDENKKLLVFFFNSIFSIPEDKRNKYFENIKNQHKSTYIGLTKKEICGNCHLFFEQRTNIGSRKCRTHIGRVENVGREMKWSCCNTTYQKLTIPSLLIENENSHFPLGCKESDHWDESAITSHYYQSNKNGYTKNNKLEIPFLLYVLLLWENYNSRPNLKDIENYISSISSISKSNEKRTEVITDIFKPTKLNEGLTRSYNLFYNMSSDNDFGSFNNSGSVSIDKKLSENNGLLSLQSLINHYTFKVTEDIFIDLIMKNILLTTQKAQKELIKNHTIDLLLSEQQNIKLIDLRFVLVSITRTN